ncbi:GntR family transcriptional regulator [Nocardia gipuzkoensis]
MVGETVRTVGFAGGTHADGDAAASRPATHRARVDRADRSLANHHGRCCGTDGRGLGQQHPHKGTVVSSVSPQRAAELYEVRAVLKGMAARQFVEHASEEQVRQLREVYDTIATGQGVAVELLEAKKRFYDTLLTGSGNVTIKEIVEGLQARVTVLRALSLVQPDRAAKSVAEIREIVEAVEARDPQRPADSCARHVRQAARTALAAMASG